MEIKQIRTIKKWGDSFGVTLNTKLMRKKKFKVGDAVEVTIRKVKLSKEEKDKLFAELAGEKMKKANIKELKLKIVEPNKEIGENQNETIEPKTS